MLQNLDLDLYSRPSSLIGDAKALNPNTEGSGQNYLPGRGATMMVVLAQVVLLYLGGEIPFSPALNDLV